MTYVECDAVSSSTTAEHHPAKAAPVKDRAATLHVSYVDLAVIETTAQVDLAVIDTTAQVDLAVFETTAQYRGLLADMDC